MSIFSLLSIYIILIAAGCNLSLQFQSPRAYCSSILICGRDEVHRILNPVFNTGNVVLSKLSKSSRSYRQNEKESICRLSSILYGTNTDTSNQMIDIYKGTFKGPSPLWYSDEMIKHCQYIIESYNALTGEALVPLELLSRDSLRAAQELFFLPNTVVLSHGIQPYEPDNVDRVGPILNYGNSMALQRFAACWEELTTFPSRYTAGNGNEDREKREIMMKKVREDGIIRGYEGIRFTFTGTKFRIKNADVWNIVVGGKYLGQAALFREWETVP